MANDVTGVPFIIDTVTATAITNDKFFVQGIVWASASVADTVVVADEDGNTKWAATQGTTNTNVNKDFNPPLFFNGLKVATLDTGTVYLYVRFGP